MRAVHVVALLVVAVCVLYAASPETLKVGVTYAALPVMKILEKTGVFWSLMVYQHTDGHYYMRMLQPPDRVERGRTFVPADHDIFIASFYQSGTHFVQQVVMQALMNGTLVFDDLKDVAHVLEFCDGVGQPLDQTLYHERKVLTTHLWADVCPYSPDRAQYIVTIRDPVDRMASSCAFMESAMGPILAVSCDTMMKHELALPDGWAAWTAGWYARRNESNVKVVMFDELRDHPVKMIKEIADFLHIPLNDTGVEMVRYRSSIEYMKANEHKFRALGVPDTFVRTSHARGREQYSKETQKEIYRVYSDKLRALGSDFDMRAFKKYNELHK